VDSEKEENIEPNTPLHPSVIQPHNTTYLTALRVSTYNMRTTSRIQTLRLGAITQPISFASIVTSLHKHPAAEPLIRDALPQTDITASSQPLAFDRITIKNTNGFSLPGFSLKKTLDL